MRAQLGTAKQALAKRVSRLPAPVRLFFYALRVFVDHRFGLYIPVQIPVWKIDRE